MTNETRENVDLLIRLANTQAMSQFEDALRELLAENEALKAEQRENLTNGFAAGADHERRKAAQVACVKPHEIERIVWEAMTWASIMGPPISGVIPAYTEHGNSLGETEVRSTAQRILSAITMRSEAEVRSMAIREFCDNSGILPSHEALGLPEDVKRFRANAALKRDTGQ